VVSLDFSVTYFLPTVPWPWGLTQLLVKMSTRNIPGVKGGRCVRLITAPPSRAECHEIWEPKPPGTLWATPGLLPVIFTFHQNCPVQSGYGWWIVSGKHEDRYVASTWEREGCKHVISAEFLEMLMLLCKIFNYPYLDGFTLNNIIVFGEGYKLWNSSSLCSFLHSLATSSHLGTDILREILGSPATHSLFS